MKDKKKTMAARDEKIPEGWREKSLAEIAPLQRGFDLPASKIENGKYPVIYSNGVGNFHTHYMVKAPGIITGRSGTIGNITFTEVDYFPHNTTLWVTSFNGNDAKFIYYLFHKIDWTRFSSGSGVPTLNRNDVHELRIMIPEDISEQHAIAEILSDMDGYIASLETLIAKKKAVKQGTMQELLTGKRRLPGFTGEWEEKKLLDVLTVGHGQSQKGIGTSSGKYSILATSGEIGKTNYFLYDKPSVLIGRKGTIDKPQYVETPFWSIDTLFYTIIKNDYLPKYFFYLFCLIDWKKYNEASGVPSLTAYNIENIDVFIPPTLAEQSAIAAVLSDMDAEIEALTAKLNKAKLIKQGMMQELLTGRIRLVNVSPMQGEFTISEYMVILAIITKLFTDTGDTGMKFLKHTRYQKLVYLYLVYKKAKTCIFEKWDYGPFSKELAYTIVPKAENEKSYIVTDNDKNICVGKNINEAVKNAINKGYYKDAEQLVGRIRYKKDTELQVLATVIESIRDLEISQKAVSLQTVKEYIGSIPVWEYKLSLEYFTDFAIDKSIKEYYDFFK